MKKIKIYTTGWCPHCKALKEFLIKSKIEFQSFDVEKEEISAEKIYEISGQYGVPVINIQGKIVVGFDEEEIRRLINL